MDAPRWKRDLVPRAVCHPWVEHGHGEVSSVLDGPVFESWYLFTIWVIFRTELRFLYKVEKAEPMFQGFKIMK